MESLKTAIGLGDATTATAHNETAGHEPLSGVTGAGTADQPYDSGNVEDSHLTSAAHTTTTSTDGKDVAAPIKSLTGDETDTAPSGAILASLASAVGLGGAAATTTDTTTHEHEHEHEQVGEKSLSGSTGHDTTEQTPLAGALSNGTHEQDPATSNSGLQFVGGSSTMNPAVSHTNGQQSHEAISKSVDEGALESKADPAHSDSGLAFISSPKDKYASEPAAKETDSHQPRSGTSGEPLVKKLSEPHSGTAGFYTIGQPLSSIQNKAVDPVSSGVPASTESSNATTIGPLSTQHKAVEPVSTATRISTNATSASTIEASPTPKDPSNISNPTAPGSDTTYGSEPLDKDGEKPVKTGPAFISSLFSNPFSKRESVSGASGDADLDPKTRGPAGSEPLPGLGNHTVPIHSAKEKRPLPTQSSPVQSSPISNESSPMVVEQRGDSATLPPNHLGSNVPPGAASPKREKGKGKMYGDTDSTSTRSSITRGESIATSQTGPSTVDSRRYSSHTPGKIPTAGGIVLGERAGQDRERRRSLAPSSHSAVTSEPQYGGRESLQKVTEDSERTSAVVPPPPQQQTSPQADLQPIAPPISAASTPVKNSTDASRTSTSGRVLGTESGSLFASPPASSRFSEGQTTSTDFAASPAAAERKPSLVTRIGRKLSIKGSKSSRGSTSTSQQPATIPESK